MRKHVIAPSRPAGPALALVVGFGNSDAAGASLREDPRLAELLGQEFR